MVVRAAARNSAAAEQAIATVIFDVPLLISALSEFTALKPGDVILTGTPASVGYRRKPQVFLTDGDVIPVEIDGIGEISSSVVNEPAAADGATRGWTRAVRSGPVIGRVAGR